MPSRADGHPVLIVQSAHYFARLHWRLRDRLPMWTVYNRATREYPGVFIARMHVTLPAPKPTRFVITHDDLDGLRDLLPAGMVRLERNPEDAPEVVEVWL